MNNEELLKLYRAGYKKALEELIEQNKGIVFKLINKFKVYGNCLDEDDLLQEAYIGIIEAADKYDFDNSKKAKFITYAVYHIYKRLTGSIVGVSTKNKENNKINNNCTSLNAPVPGDEENDELINFIEDPEQGYNNIEDKLYFATLRKELEGAMNTNNTLQEREILKLRYGWDISPITPKETSGILDINVNKVRSIETKSLKKLRESVWGRTKGRKYRDELIGTHYNYQYVNNSFDEELELLQSI